MVLHAVYVAIGWLSTQPRFLRHGTLLRIGKETMSTLTSDERWCICSDPENCTQRVPGYRCKKDFMPKATLPSKDEVPHWDDVAAALRDLAPIMPEGMRPLAIQAATEIEQLRGLKPELPPRPPDGEGLPRFGLRHNGPGETLATPMADGYWTPWHLAERALIFERGAPETGCAHEWIEVPGKRGLYKPSWFCPKCHTGQRERPAECALPAEKAEGRPVRPHRSGGQPVAPAFRDERLHRIDALMDAKVGTPEGVELDKLVNEQVNAEKANLPQSVSMEGQPMGDPHPCDLTRAGRDPITGKAMKTRGDVSAFEQTAPPLWDCACNEPTCAYCGPRLAQNGEGSQK